MNLDDVLPTFLAESRELLEEAEHELLALSRHVDNPSAHVNAVFRAAHTIKGSAGLFGLTRIVAFTHDVESVLDRARAGALTLDAPLITLLLACLDHIGILLDVVVQGGPGQSHEGVERDAELQSRLAAYLAEASDATAMIDATAGAAMHDAAFTSPDAATHDAVDALAGGMTNSLAESATAPAADSVWHVSLRVGTDVLRHGLDPMSFLRYLATLGDIVFIETLFDALPDASTFDAESAYLGYELRLRTSATQRSIESVFDFMQDNCSLDVLASTATAQDYWTLAERRPESSGRLRDLFVRAGAFDADAWQEVADPSLAGAVSSERSSVGRHPESSRIDVARIDTTRVDERRYLRVDADRLDHLIDLVGELISLSASAQATARRTGNAELLETHSSLSSLVESVRDSALALRMVRIGTSFNRFQRIVHDVAQELGKDIDLVITGEDTELDKSVVDHIADPLMHLVRNAMDHGLETTELRLARGKPAQGRVGLHAFHDSGAIVIEVTDDGRGLDRDRILAKAIERGVADSNRVYTDDEIYEFIFEPGFSTADRVTRLSGRGVGMDVVKRNITELRGSISLRSRAGEGTTVSVRLPLTLAIIEGFQVRVGTSVFVLPLDTIDECIAYSSQAQHDYTDLRGKVLPFIRLQEVFGLPSTTNATSTSGTSHASATPDASDASGMPGTSGTSRAPSARQNIVVVRHAGVRAGLVVDALLGECQAVIKPLGPWFDAVPGISGSSIDTHGDVVLILDVPALIARAIAAASATHPATPPALRPPTHPAMQPLTRSLTHPLNRPALSPAHEGAFAP